MQTIRTGMVYQRTVKGPNYVCLGRTTVEGKTVIISVKNGNINYNGKCKKSVRGRAVVLEAHAPEKIARIHDVRKIDVESVFENGNASTEKKVTRLLKSGVKTEAELPNVRALR